MTHDGKAVIVTGGARGIGRGIVERFAADGAHVVIADVDRAAAEELAAEVGDRASAAVVDVTDEQAVERCVRETVDRFGRLDVMVNNAGIVQVAPLLESTVADWRTILDVNVVGIYLGAKHAAAAMVELGRGGVILNAASGAGRKGAPNFSAYCATKAAIINMTQSFALELAPHRIRVNCYQPGHVQTPLWDGLAAGWQRVTGQGKEEMLATFLGTVPWGRFGTPEDVAAVCSFLAADEAEYVTGQAIAMNGAEMLF